MIRSLAVAAALWPCLAATPGPVLAEGLDASAQSAMERCRQAFPEAALNPTATGGWLADRLGSARTLCLYGTVAVAPEGFNTALGAHFDLVIVRSTGGPVTTWLSAAEQLLGHVDTVIVDEACFSSCANYIIPLGRTVSAPPNSLVVWHGGPTIASLGDSGSSAMTINELMSYYDLADRTERLYDELGISVKILDDSSRGDPDRPLSGYAFSPETLARCYGFANVAALWHAGDDAEVAALGHRRSARLNLAEAPRTACTD